MWGKLKGIKMNRYEQIQTCAQIRDFVQRKQYRSALNLMGLIELERFKNRTDQLDFIEVYMHTMHYEDARELLLLLYDVYPTCHVLHDLFLVSLKLHEPVNASEYLEEYKEQAPRDPERLIMEYMLEKHNGATRAELILILRQLKAEEYSAQWGYELAKLYHKEGRREECIEECNDLITWFEKGNIVNKAITLKQLYLEKTEVEMKERRSVFTRKHSDGEADKLIEEATRICRDLYVNVVSEESQEKAEPEEETQLESEKQAEEVLEQENIVKKRREQKEKQVEQRPEPKKPERKEKQLEQERIEEKKEPEEKKWEPRPQPKKPVERELEQPKTNPATAERQGDKDGTE